MKRGYSKLLYGQRNKNETIVSVIKRLFGEHITSRLVRTQNRELSFRCIAYNTHRITNLTIIIDGFYIASRCKQFYTNRSYICKSYYDRYNELYQQNREWINKQVKAISQETFFNDIVAVCGKRFIW